MFLQYTKCLVAIELKYYDCDFFKTCVARVDSVAKSIKTNEVSKWEVENSLRTPLQPLYTNLDTNTYETFERDPIKYVLYQRAIEAAMRDKIPETEKETKQLVLMIVGAGRGPLIRAAVNAMKITKRKLKIIVVEKNPNAIVTLSNLIKLMFKNFDIKLIAKDMRKMQLEEKADILVSELLGSFGDNELSPECLDGAQKHLKPDGISIPCMSTSYIRPVMTSKIYQQLDRLQPIEAENGMYEKTKEMNHLVFMCSAYYIDDPKQLWKFEHPNNNEVIDNSRYCKLQFQAKVDCVLHGFSGYFVAKLYKDIEISILPATHTQGLFSWFPMFFPTIDPLYIKRGEEITVEFWRKVEPNVKVWYEWRANEMKIANEGGENHPIRM